jgi:Peptidase S46
MLKKLFLSITVIIVFANIPKPVKADEGMWLPLLVDRLNYVDMQKMGLHLTSDEIYSVNHSSMKDAIVQFGYGCTGAVISKEGLVITNHHCGLQSIQANSTIENDYITNGFWAKNKNEELSCDGLAVTFLIKIEDVTQKILGELNDKMTEKERSAKVDELSAKIKAEAIKDTPYEASVKGFFEGNEYYLFVSETFKDVRMVGAPPTCIGDFGGDTDNWMWPRHTGDFSIFRIYTAPDGKPAEYSKNNIPLKPKYSLPVSIAGYKTNDFSMILGFPGTTDRFLTSYGINLTLEQSNPSIIKIRTEKLSIMKADMDASPEVKLKYTAKYQFSSNYWKYYIGQSKGLMSLKLYDTKKEIEDAFSKWVNSSNDNKAKYGEALTDISNAYKELNKYTKARWYFLEGLMRGCEIITYAHRFDALYDDLNKDQPDRDKINKDVASLKSLTDKYFKDYNAPTDQKLFAAMVSLFYNDVNLEYRPDIFNEISKKYKNDFKQFASDIFRKSIFANQNKIENFLSKPEKSILEKDPGYKILQSVMEKYTEITAKITEANNLLSRGNRIFMAGLKAMDPEKKFYPNANSTMRMSYGKVLDYFPKDAVHYDFCTTLKGVIDKEDSTNEEFIVPKKLKELYETKDYGRYAENGEIKVCFLTNNDITGGNSGSPVINGDGQLIGLAFDCNWEAMTNNIAYSPDLQRSICVDMRYVLFIIDKYAGATNLIKEMNIVDKSNKNKNSGS